MSDASMAIAVLRQLYRSLGFFYIFPKVAIATQVLWWLPLVFSAFARRG